MNPRIQAGLVMFLTFFGWGVFLVPMGSYVEQLFGAPAIGWAYGMGPLAAMVSPLIAGWLTDKRVAPSKFLFASFMLSGLFLAAVPFASSSSEFYALIFAHSLCFFASLPVLNSAVLSMLSDPGKEFGAIRLFGTLGWIVSGLTIAYLLGIRLRHGAIDPATGLQELRWYLDINVSSKPIVFHAGALALILVSFLSLGFKSPASVSGASANMSSIPPRAGIFTLLKDSQFLVFIIFSFLISIPLALYYSFGNLFLKTMNVSGTEAFMTWGQISEVVFLLLLPVLAHRFSAKSILLLGIGCWALRYWLFAEYPSEFSALLVAVLLHGACYDFFFVAGTLYADKRAPEGLRNSAQSMVVWVTLGLGMAIGQIVLAPWLAELFISKGPEGALVFAKEFWLYPAAFAAALLVVFALVFRDDTRLSDAKE